MHRTFPTARYGKASTSRATAESEYRLLYSSASFPQHALREFERLAVAMQWSGGGGDEEYAACFALWPLADGAGALLGRFSDVGTDALDRPHTLLVEAAYLAEPQILASPACLANLLMPTSWPGDGAPLDGELSLVITDDSTLAARSVYQAFSADQRPQRVFVASHPCYRVRGFDLVLETCPPARSLGRFPAVNELNGVGQSGTRKTRVGMKKVNSLRVACMALFVLCVALGWLVYRLKGSLAETRQMLQQERELRATTEAPVGRTDE